MTKISFDLDHTELHGHPAETLWADPVPELGPLAFRLKNSPFFVMGISYLDIVEATPTEGDALFDFKRVIRRGEHSTYMLLVEEGERRFADYWGALERQGCTYEKGGRMKLSIGHRRFYSIDVAPSADLENVLADLERGQIDGVWMYQQGYRYSP
jgi:hypothetical protein